MALKATCWAADALRRSRSSRGLATFAGLKHKARFVHEPHIHKVDPAQALPVLRLVSEDGQLQVDSLPCSLEQYLDMYKCMLKVSVVDQVMNSLQRQGRISFYMTGIGEEAAQVGPAAALHKDDVIWAQYRELGTFMYRGFSIQQMVSQCFSRFDEPGKGRQMPVHYCDASIGMQAITSPLGTQIPQAVGAGYGFRISGERRVGVAFFGEGAASEGDFAVALNFAATLQSQVLFICRNNGWAISTPAEEQYAGDGIAARALAYGMSCIRVDGNDLAAVYVATKEARELSLEGRPVLLELMTYRQGHHSTSDDAGRYRDSGKVKSMARTGLEPISRSRLVLKEAKMWDDAQEEELKGRYRQEVMEALKVAESKPFASVKDMFRDVWAELTPELERQRQDLIAHVERHPGHYAQKLAKFQDGKDGL
eukprot:s5998_g2.t2